MRKHFLLFFLMALLPLAGWAAIIDVEVRPFDASVDWTGAKPAQVQSSWITCTPSVDASVKADIAAALTIQDLDSYNAGSHTYKLQKIYNSVTSGGNTYNLMVSSSYSAELTINQILAAPTVDASGITNATGLAYTSFPQALLTAGATATTNGVSVDVMYATSSTAETWYSLADFKETNAGSYDVWYKVVGNDNYVGSEPEQLVTQTTIAQLNQAVAFAADGAKPTANTWTYDAQAHVLFTAPTAAVAFGTYEYSLTGADETWYTSEQIAASEDLTAAFKGTSNTGNKTVYWRVLGTDNYTGFDATALTATIAKATPTFTTEPTFADEFEYDGQVHQLITNPGVAEFGATPSFALRYKRPGATIFGSWITIHGSNWSENYELRTATNAGVYEIAYCTKTTDDLIKADTKYKKITVLQKEIPTDSYTAPAANENLKANGEAQALITAGSWNVDPALGEFQYKVGEGAWGNTVPQETAAGTYTVYSKIVATSNYKDVDLGSVDVTIAAKDQVTIAIPAGQSFGYGTTPTLEYTADWGENQGGDALDETGLTWSWFSDEAGATPATPGAIGDYYVTVSGLAVTGPTSASKEIVYPIAPVLVKITAGQVNASISGEATYGSLPTFTLTHVSGLSETEAAGFDADNLTTVTVKQGTTTVLDGVVKNADGLKALDAGEYDLEATATLANYNVVVAAGKLTVNPNAGYAFTIEDIAAVEYKAAKWEPEVTVTGLAAGTDYTVSYGNNTHNNKDAGTGIVVITGIGNYAGATGSKTFTINKADLTITADNFTGEKAWTYGTDEPTYTATVTGYLDGESFGGTLAGIEGTLKVKRTSNETVGMHTGALVAGFYDADDNKIAAPEATNYNLIFNPGDLQVAKAGATIQLKADVAATLFGTYGISNADAKTQIETALRNINNYEVVEASMPAAELPYVDVASVTCDLADAEYQVNQNYNFTATGATSTNYGITIAGGSYTVKPAPITLYANDQAIDWSDTDSGNDAADTEVKPATVSIAAGDLKYTDALADVVASIVIASQNVGTNNISLTAAENANYNIVVNSDGTNAKYGVLTVTGAPALALSTADPDLADKLASYNGESMPVTIDFSARNGRNLGGERNWVKNNWVTMTLPFDISVADLSKALGYAIVNVIDDTKTVINGTSSEFYGKLTMKGGNGNVNKLAANKPFMVKIADDIVERNGGVIDFGTQTIVAPASADDLSVAAGLGAKFTGTYATKNVTSADNAAIWFLIGGGYTKWAYIKSDSPASWDIVPFEAYFKLPENSPVGSIKFFFEEEDGTVTAIESVNAEGANSAASAAEGWYTINGVKLEAKPTQKGIYIFNGKKVAIQ